MKSLVFILVLILSLESIAQDSTIVKLPTEEIAKAEIKKSDDTSKVFIKTLAKTFGLQLYLPSEKPKIAFLRSLFLPGWGQYTNRDYWKMGLVYGAAGTGWYFGSHTNNLRYKRYLGHYEKAVFLSRSLVFYDESSLTSSNALPTNSTLYLSDNANNDIFYLLDSKGNQYTLEKKTGLINDFQSEYFIAIASSDTDIIGAYSSDTFKSAKNQFRRWRDASIIGFAVGWLFFALEANVSAHLKSFDVSDDISFKVTPAGPASFGMQASGVKLAFQFK
jgi:hypothetical protein